MKSNKHNHAVPADVLAQAQTKVDELRDLLAPYMLALTPAERHELPKMGPKTIGFVKKAYDFARQNPKLVPNYLDMDVYGIDCEDAHGLWTLVNSIRQVEQNAADTEMAAGSEAYQASLVFYNSVKAAMGQNIPGAKAVFQELKTRFPRGSRRASEDATETEATEALQA